MASLAGGKHAGGSRLTAHLHTAVPRSGVTSSRLHTAAVLRRGVVGVVYRYLLFASKVV